jgi:hypothetical protein
MVGMGILELLRIRPKGWKEAKERMSLEAEADNAFLRWREEMDQNDSRKSP